MTPKIIYFALPGRAEVARLMFSITGKEFEVRLRRTCQIPQAQLQQLAGVAGPVHSICIIHPPNSSTRTSWSVAFVFF
jgi:hypothetical protein